MKSILKTVLISTLSAFVVIVAYNYLNSDNNDVLENVSKSTNLLPTTYSFNTSKVAAEMTDFTIAAEKTVNGVVHDKILVFKKTISLGGTETFMEMMKRK